MQIDDKFVTQIQELYRTKFGMEISRQYAYESGQKLLTLLRIVYRPIPQEVLEKEGLVEAVST